MMENNVGKQRVHVECVRVSGLTVLGLLLWSGLSLLPFAAAAATAPKAWVREQAASTSTNCSALSPPENVKYWDAMDHCYACAGDPSCGFCQSTMTCAAGDANGPLDRYKLWCGVWISSPDSCPVNPQCNALTDCGACAGSRECVWCASSSTCLATEEIYGSGCKSVVANAPCPAVIVPGTYSRAFCLSIDYPNALAVMS